jgi:hypothetical protein
MKLLHKNPSCVLRQNTVEKKRGKEIKVEEDVSND